MAGGDDSLLGLQLSKSNSAYLERGPVAQAELAGGEPVYTLLHSAYWRLKRPIGFALALLLILTTLPVLVAISLVLAQQGRPVFITRKRLGRYGRPFISYYFRTMRPDALRALAEGNAEQPTTDAFGRFLLHTRLDRLPLLWNVLKGDMNLIGPRPLSQEELIGSGRSARHSLSVRPGLTGLWWLEGETDLRRRLALDRTYLEHANPLLDTRILFRTLILVHSGGSGRTPRTADHG